MPAGLRRLYGKQDLHFLTFSCYRRLPLLETIRAPGGRYKNAAGLEESPCATLHVVMPEHVHLLISEPKKGTPSTVLQVLKQCVSRRMRKRKRKSPGDQMQLDFCEVEVESRQFWQARFYDFNVHSYGKVKEKLHYMHANPVIRHLVEHPKDWPWSSWSNSAKKGQGSIGIDPV